MVLYKISMKSNVDFAMQLRSSKDNINMKTNYIQRPSNYMPIEELKKWIKENKLITNKNK